MNYWRISCRAGNQGKSLWPSFFRLGVAAITYLPLVKTDLSRFPKREPRWLWKKLKPTQNASLSRVAFEIKGGDVIYVKDGSRIVGKGLVLGPEGKRAYKFEKVRFQVPDGTPWSHQVPVRWATQFPEIKLPLRGVQWTVLKLSPKEVLQFESRAAAIGTSVQQAEVLEGKAYLKEAIFRSRNIALIQAKKANSNFCCEVCGFNYSEAYGTAIGGKYIVAHHLNPIASGPSINSLDDIALVCANCHAMIHTKTPPMEIALLQKAVARERKR